MRTQLKYVLRTGIKYAYFHHPYNLEYVCVLNWELAEGAYLKKDEILSHTADRLHLLLILLN